MDEACGASDLVGRLLGALSHANNKALRGNNRVAGQARIVSPAGQMKVSNTIMGS